MDSWSNYGWPAIPGKIHHCSSISPIVNNGSHRGSLESQSHRNGIVRLAASLGGETMCRFLRFLACFTLSERVPFKGFAALRLRIRSYISSYHCAIWSALFDNEADQRSREFWAFIGDTDIHRDGLPTGTAAIQRCLILCCDLKLHIVGLLII